MIESSAKPFLIISNINLPKLDGLALKEKVHNIKQLWLRCISCLCFTTSAAQKTIIDAYSQSVQGFFVKPSDVAHFKHTLKVVVEYWKECMSPNYSEPSVVRQFANAFVIKPCHRSR